MAQDNSERTIRRKLAGSDHMVEAVFDFPVMVLRDDGEWVTRNSWSLRGAEGNWDPSYIVENGELVELSGCWEAAPELPFVEGDC